MRANFLSYVQNPEVPELIDAIYSLDIEPDTDASTAGTQREDLVEVFLTGVCSKATTPAAPAASPALEADLNSQLLNRDVDDRASSPSEMLRLNMSVPATPADPISGSACSAVTSTASRTAAGSPTTSSTSSSRCSRAPLTGQARRRHRAVQRRGRQPTTSPSSTRSRTSRSPTSGR